MEKRRDEGRRRYRRLPSTRWSPSVSVEGEAYKEGYLLITCPALYDFVIDFCLEKAR